MHVYVSYTMFQNGSLYFFDVFLETDEGRSSSSNQRTSPYQPMKVTSPPRSISPPNQTTGSPKSFQGNLKGISEISKDTFDTKPITEATESRKPSADLTTKHQEPLLEGSKLKSPHDSPQHSKGPEENYSKYDPSEDYTTNYDTSQHYEQTEQYDPNQHYDPNQQYDPNQHYDPNQEYDPNQQYNPNQYDPSAQYDPNSQYDLGENYDPNMQYQTGGEYIDDPTQQYPQGSNQQYQIDSAYPSAIEGKTDDEKPTGDSSDKK